MGVVAEVGAETGFEYHPAMKQPIELRDDPEGLAKVIRDIGANTVGIDGCDGVGKSTLALRLIELLGGSIVDVDDHLERERGRYVAALRIDDFKNALNAAVSPSGPRFVTGICLTDVWT